jgi:hypothetical protein
MKEEYLTTPAVEKKPVAGTQEFIEIFFKKENGQQKTAPDKATPAPPAPFYDELHFGNYE